MRAQTSLPVLGVALLFLTVTTLFAVSVADGQLAAAESSAGERDTAAGIAERLVTPDSPVTVRGNVVRDGALSSLSVPALRRTFGLGDEDAVRVSLGGSTVLATGDPGGGSTVERIVLVESRTEETVTPRFNGTRSVTLPRRTNEVSLDLSPTGSAGIQTVRSNGAVVLYDPDGLSGTYTVNVTRFETATLTFQGPGRLSRGDAAISYRPPQTRKARLRVTVDKWGDSDG